MSNIIYIVEWTDTKKSQYWITLKCFNDKRVAQAYCDYRKEYETEENVDYRVVEEEVI